MALRLYTDGSAHEGRNKGIAGWAYSLMDDDTVILAECGATVGRSTEAENMAIINGLLALPPRTPVTLVTDRNEIASLDSNPYLTSVNREKVAVVVSQRRLILTLLTDNVTVEIIKSKTDKFHNQVDEMARHACGLPARKRKTTSKRKLKKMRKRANAKVNSEARDCFELMSRPVLEHLTCQTD